MTADTGANAPRNSGSGLDTLLTEMRESCAALEAKTLEHDKLLGDERFDEFVHSLASRSPLIERLAQASASLDSILSDPNASSAYPEHMIRDARKELDELSMVVANVLRQDERHQKLVEDRRDALSGQLSGVKQGRHAIRAYSGSASRNGPRLQDREG